MPQPFLHITLHEPQIPNNTGNIGRTCVATGCALHLIHPLAFDTSEKACRRAGLDYWPRLDIAEHADWSAYIDATGASSDSLWLYTTKTDRPHWDVSIKPGDHLVFGKETQGLPTDLLDRFADRLVTLPMVQGERSLNIATAVTAAIYEAMRQAAIRRGRLLPSL